MTAGACATLLFAGGTQAQSSVTLYGVIDNVIDVSNQGGGTIKKLQSGGAYGSRLGFTGSEDLGDGLAAVFTLEMGISTDTGVLQQGGRAFGRQAFVGLAGKWGSLTLGRQYAPQFYTLAARWNLQLPNTFR